MHISSSSCYKTLPPPCLSFLIVYFKNGSEYLTSGTVSVFIPFMKFVFEKFSCSSEVLLSNFFFHICLYDAIRFQYFQIFVILFFYKCSDAFLYLVLLFFLSFLFTTFFIISIAHFSIQNSIPICLLKILLYKCF